MAHQKARDALPPNAQCPGAGYDPPGQGEISEKSGVARPGKRTKNWRTGSHDPIESSLSYPLNMVIFLVGLY